MANGFARVTIRGRTRKPTLERLEDRRVFAAGAGGAAATGLEVVRSELWVQGITASAFVVTFNKPLAPGPAQNPLNYTVFSTSPVAPVPLAAAVYVPSLNSVFLVPSHTVPVGRYVVESGAAGAPSAVVDATGQPIKNPGTTYPTGELFATFPAKGSSPGVVMQAAAAAAHRKKALNQTLNRIFNPFGI